MDDPVRHPGPGDEVGLGRVVSNPSHLGTGETARLDEASEASFPASDPSALTPEAAGADGPDRKDAPPDPPLSDPPSA